MQNSFLSGLQRGIIVRVTGCRRDESDPSANPWPPGDDTFASYELPRRLTSLKKHILLMHETKRFINYQTDVKAAQKAGRTGSSRGDQAIYSLEHPCKTDTRTPSSPQIPVHGFPVSVIDSNQISEQGMVIWLMCSIPLDSCTQSPCKLWPPTCTNATPQARAVGTVHTTPSPKARGRGFSGSWATRMPIRGVMNRMASNP